MPGRPLPVPDSSGIYSFPDELLAALGEWQEHLKSLRDDTTQQVIELVAPLNGDRYVIAERVSHGRPVWRSNHITTI
jgi:hypothetical protein